MVEASIAELRAALESGETSSAELTRAYLERIDAYDKSGPTLNALVVINPDAMLEARASDARRDAVNCSVLWTASRIRPRTAIW